MKAAVFCGLIIMRNQKSVFLFKMPINVSVLVFMVNKLRWEVMAGKWS